MSKSVALLENEAVELTVLGENDTRFITGHARSHQGSVVWLDAESAVPAGAAAKIVWRNMLFLGEVQGCSFQNNLYSLRVEIEHALYDTELIMRLAEGFLNKA